MGIFEEPLVFVDIETNGLNHIRGRVIEVAVIRVEGGEIVREFRQLINPGSPLPQFITNLTGIASRDLAGAPVFLEIANELHEILDGAVFVAHNVRFDYSFLKQEFKRVGKEFRPQQICTVKLSRALYPQHRTHKLQDLIARHGLQVAERHRAYDDAHALWQFVQLVQRESDPDLLYQAIAKQLKKPSLPKGLDASLLASLPEDHGVYIFEDEAGNPIYVGKSVNIKQRVASHFMRDHENVGEFKIAQHVRNITFHQTEGELHSLLLESKLVKQMQPLYNKQLRRTEKLTLAKRVPNEQGYITVVLQEAAAIDLQDIPDVLAIYPRRGKAKDSVEQIMRDWSLCPKLCGLEKSSGACFLYQLRKCGGACVSKESPEAYNQRLLTAFEKVRIESWPYASPVLVQARSDAARHSLVLDQWCVIAEVTQEDYCEPVITTHPRVFDLDTYKIIQSYFRHKMRELKVTPITIDALRQMTAG